MKPRRLSKFVLILALTLPLWTLSGCSNTELVPTPVVVEIEGPVKWREIPGDLLILHQPATLPEALTYGEGALLWIEDRLTIRRLLAQLEAIGELAGPGTGGVTEPANGPE